MTLVCKFSAGDGSARVGVIDNGAVRALKGVAGVTDGLRAALGDVGARLGPVVPDARLLAPLDAQEVWAAGVTYVRSKRARMDESSGAGAASFYDRVYTAPRPELFFKATPSRVVGPGEPIRARVDSTWTVPEPEIALWLDPDLQLLGVGLANDVSARDIEGENPLYLPQAKIYTASCALGPTIWAQTRFDAIAELVVRLRIRRGGACIFEGAIAGSALHRSPQEMIEYLGRDNAFPDGVVLLTGTGIVPPDDLALGDDDVVEVSAEPLGALVNSVRAAAHARVG